MLLERINSDKPFEAINPWYKGYSGDIIRKDDGNYEVKCVIEMDP